MLRNSYLMRIASTLTPTGMRTKNAYELHIDAPPRAFHFTPREITAILHFISVTSLAFLDAASPAA